MTQLYERLKEMSETTDLVSCKTDGVHEVFCYTKTAFFGGNWSEDLKKARGLLFRDGVQINEPFDKIFNLDEQEETTFDRIQRKVQNEPYLLMDKSNGHLFIISAYRWNGEVKFVYSTKGSLPNPNNELLNADIELFNERYREQVERSLEQQLNRNHASFITVCTEALVEHDKHTLYDTQTEQYGENTFVVLGSKMGYFDGRIVEEPRSLLHYLAMDMGLPVVHFYDESTHPHKFVRTGDMKKLLDFKDIEGFVLWFPNDGFRVKFKTKEYWALRFKKDLTPEKVLKVFEKGGYERIRMKLPEEISEQIIELIDRCLSVWSICDLVDSGSLTKEQRERKGKELFTSTDLTTHQKQYIKMGNTAFVASLPDRKEMRKMFFDAVMDNYLEVFTDQLNQIVEEM